MQSTNSGIDQRKLARRWPKCKLSPDDNRRISTNRFGWYFRHVPFTRIKKQKYKQQDAQRCGISHADSAHKVLTDISENNHMTRDSSGYVIESDAVSPEDTLSYTDLSILHNTEFNLVIECDEYDRIEYKTSIILDDTDLVVAPTVQEVQIPLNKPALVHVPEPTSGAKICAKPLPASNDDSDEGYGPGGSPLSSDEPICNSTSSIAVTGRKHNAAKETVSQELVCEPTAPVSSASVMVQLPVVAQPPGTSIVKLPSKSSLNVPTQVCAVERQNVVEQNVVKRQNAVELKTVVELQNVDAAPALASIIQQNTTGTVKSTEMPFEKGKF